MISDHVLGFVLFMAFALSFCPVAVGDEATAPAGSDAHAVTLVVTGEVAQLCHDVLGYRYPAKTIVYSCSPSGQVWTVSTKGRHGSITSRFEIKDRTMAGARVLSHKEQRGKPVASGRFLRQFKGLVLKNMRLNRRVHAITGATVSSKAVTDAALLALRLEANYDKHGGDECGQ